MKKAPSAVRSPSRPPADFPPAPFIVGVGRSGTTLLRLMLDAHSTLAIPPEVNFRAALDAFERAGVDAAVQAIVANELWGDYNLPADEFEHRVERRHPRQFPDVLRVFYEFYAERQGKRRWGNKTPYFLARMTSIQRLIPEARFVHIVRDGRDVALSTVPIWFGPDDVPGVAREWSGMLSLARRQAGELDHYIEIRYEDLVCEPESVLRELCEFLELEWEPAMLDYHRDAAERLSSELDDVVEGGLQVSGGERRAIHRLVDRPPQLDRVECWRREMNTSDRRAFEAIAGDTLREFGYEVA
jgi:Sulfotransferase family